MPVKILLQATWPVSVWEAQTFFLLPLGHNVLPRVRSLGVGGAERLVLDAALALQARGCSVRIWTAHYDPGHCFAESRELPVRCAGDWLPRSLGWGGRGAAVCAYVRMIFLALYVLFLADEEFDVVVCDQVRRPRPALAAPPSIFMEGALHDFG